MSCCTLIYIPERLHYTEEKGIINCFYIGDFLYRRVKESLLSNPFGTLSLTDLSHNLGIHNNIETSKKSDVLFSILEDEEREVYEEEVLSLKIISLDVSNRYNKLFLCEKNSLLSVRITLVHSPVCCMYPHCVFQFFVFDDTLNNEEVTFKNYKDTLGSKKFKYLRDKLRHELSLMIIREEISYEDYS